MSPISYAQKMRPPKPTKAEAEVKPEGWVEEPTVIEIKTKELEALKEKEKAAGRPLIGAPIPAVKLTKQEEAEAAKLADLSILASDIPVPPAKPVIIERTSRPKKF